MANDGSTPQACTATVSIEVVEVLPCVPATAMLRRPAITAASATARGSTRRPRSRRRDQLGVVGADRGGDDDGVGVAEVRRVVPDVRPVAPSARSASSVGVSRASLPETGTPRASRIRAMPLIPAPPMPTKCTRAELARRRHRPGPGGDVSGAHVRPAATLEHDVGQRARRRRGAPRARPRAGRSRPARPGRSAAARSVRGDPLRRAARRRRPAARRRPRRPAGRCSRCSPLPMRQRHERRGQARPRTARRTVIAPDRHSARSAAA